MILDVTTVHENGGEIVPTAFKLGATCLVISEIMDRWPAKDYSYFKVRANDEALYILRHDKFSGQWELTWFSRNGDGY
ncbi:hypothetical protein Q8A64_07975 [Oxalobacteraceae bacterium R-40]|uniref:Uncharacterized protein n=1 Tax=Keguizhuia sedimenti TaxID=3064264 RepID=A0ABU1BNC1_9BURK|nr:hypothetical protein [Oxalobacteraceae bacterium R-40]